MFLADGQFRLPLLPFLAELFDLGVPHSHEVTDPLQLYLCQILLPVQLCLDGSYLGCGSHLLTAELDQLLICFGQQDNFLLKPRLQGNQLHFNPGEFPSFPLQLPDPLVGRGLLLRSRGKLTRDCG